MKTNLANKLGITLAGVLALTVASARADDFGSGGNAFTIDFVNIGNPGNADDAGAGGGLYSLPYGGVPYTYRMGTYEISENAIVKATAGGLTNVTAGYWTGSQPANLLTWFEAAAFVNWLNTSTGHHAAYNLSQIPPDINGGTWTMTLWSSAEAWQLGGQNLYRHKDSFYFLPSMDEWYKAAYHKNDGVTANYWDYATGSNTIPTAVASGTGEGTAVYNYLSRPADVEQAGGLSPYGTRGQGGNAWELQESSYAAPNDGAHNDRTLSGGSFDGPAQNLRSWEIRPNPVRDELANVGFRVASVVPEPTTAVSLLLGLGLLASRRNRQARTREVSVLG